MDSRESIRNKLRSVILWTCASVLFLTILSFVLYEVHSFRRTHLEGVATLAEVMASTCTSSLAFKNQEDAANMLSALTAEPTINLAVLYASDGSIFAIHPRAVTTNQVPPSPGEDRKQYENGKLVVVEPVVQATRQGTLYLEADLTPLFQRLQLYSLIVLLVLAASFLLAYALSTSLQKRITTPILNLAALARKVSEARDYGVRARKQSEDEIGVLTDAFNHMLGQIAERDAALLETARSLQLALESSQTGTWRWDTIRNRLSWDEHLQRLFGLAPGELGSTFQEFLNYVHPEDRSSLDNLMTRSLEEKNEFEAEFRIELADGSIRHMASRGRAIEDQNGRPVAMTGVMLDVTENKQAELALRESEERFRTMADAAPVMIWTANEEGAWDYVNSAWTRFTGRPARDDLGRAWQTVIHPEDLPACVAAYDEALATQTAFDAEFRCLRHDQKYRYMTAHGVQRFDPSGKFAGYIGTCIDITEIKEAQTDLERRVTDRTAELAETNRELESFTYSVSHDLRAPLRHINAYAQILQEECGSSLDDDGQRYLSRIRQGTRNMGMLVDDLLNLARVGRQELSFQLCDLNEIVQEVMGEMRGDLQGRTIDWRICKIGSAECDPGLMKQVFANLLSNAIKYTRPRNPAVIEIGQMEVDHVPAVFVRDNGVGFSMKYSNKLFGVFQRLHRAEDFEGTGVGLATVERIIRKHGGRIWAEAELDKGATFYFTLGGSRLRSVKEEQQINESTGSGDPARRG